MELQSNFSDDLGNKNRLKSLFFMVPAEGLEPPTL